MELLIPGLILVAIMVWASTRIKRNAAAAFDEELIDAEEFAVTKPEGFLHVLNDNSGLLFRAYSKEFGTVGRSDIRQAVLEIERHAGRSVEEVVERVKRVSETLDPETDPSGPRENGIYTRSVQIRDGAEFEVLHRFVPRGVDVVEARGLVLTEHKEDLLAKIKDMLDSFRVK